MILIVINSKLLVCTVKISRILWKSHCMWAQSKLGLDYISSVACKLSRASATCGAIYEHFFLWDFCVESTAFFSLLFMCADDAATMTAAFDGRFDADREVDIRRSGCVQHRLYPCIVDSFIRGKISELGHFMNQISYFKTYYNTHISKAVNLPFRIPTKSCTRE